MRTSILPDYAELHCASNFTFLHGASHPEELVERAVKLGYHSLAISDECSLAGVVRAHVEAKKHGLHLIIGSEMTLECGIKLVLLATNRIGYGNLSELITLGRRRAEKGRYCLRRSDFEIGESAHPHLAHLPECLAIFIPQRGQSIAQLTEQATWLKRVFGDRLSLGVELLHRMDDDIWLELLLSLSDATNLPPVATGDVLMHVRSRKPLQDALTAIRIGKSLPECGFALQPNAEQHLRSRMRLAQLYPAHLLAQTIEIAKRCKFSLGELRYEYPEEIAPAGETLPHYFRRLVYQGAATRFPRGTSDKVRGLIEKELALISELNYEAYFLTVYDIVRFARSRDILCQGRGSAANSAVCYCLRITEVDPDIMDVLFERFISRERNEPPDIDVDFEHQRREEVIQYIYGKYGRHRAGLTATVITYRPRSAFKDIGKALGIDFEQMNQLSRAQQWWDGKELSAERLLECGFDPASSIVHKLVWLSKTLIGFPRHLSQHTGGFVIARDSLARLVPIENAAMKERSVIEWDKDDLDALGLLKVDVLALGMLSALKRALDMMSWRYGKKFDLQDIPREDPVTYQMMCGADTVGVFQIESRAQMSMLPRLQPVRFYDLVIQVAIVRPGPIQGGMVHPYLNRRQRKDETEYPKGLEAALARTLGIPIFQEQVMQVAMIAAGFSAGEADDLRRSMAAWKRKGNMEQFYSKIKEGMKERNYPEDFAERICKQIEGFGEYGFPESHAASFAILAYFSAWIKCHEPAIFLAALLNSQPMGFYSPSQLIQDAKRHGVRVLPVDVGKSDVESILETDIAADDGQQPVRLGLQMTKGLTLAGAERIVAARADQPFADVGDLGLRAELSQHDLQALANANALVTLAGHRRQANWEVAGMTPVTTLLKHAPITEAPLALLAASEGQEILADYRSLGLTLQRHPLALLRPTLKKMNLSTALEMKGFADRKLVRTAGLVVGRQRPGTAKGTVFVTLEDETGNTNVIIWPALMEKQRKEILNATLLTVYGIWQCESGVRHLVAKRVVDHSRLLGQLRIGSRNFH